MISKRALQQNRLFYAFLFFVFTLFLLPANIGYAQTATCSNGTIIEVEGGYTLDWDALCAAGQSWQDKGIQVVIYLTHFQPETENDWYDHLDAAEVELGLISADRTVDNFAPDVLAIEATTNASSDFGATITFGRELYDTPLDSDTAVQTIKADMLDNLQRENYTEALATALEQSYILNYPAPTLGDNLVRLALWGLGLLVILSILNHFFGAKLKRRWQTRQQSNRLEDQIETVSIAVTHLLALLDGFIEAPTPEDSLLYRIYFTQGADKYDDLLDTAVAHIREMQTNLRHAFNHWQQLPLPEDITLEKQRIRIISLYLKLMGTMANQENLTDDHVREQLSPFFAATNPAYAEELAACQTLTQKPLTLLKPHTMPRKVNPGILDEIVSFKVELLRLVNAKENAKPALMAIRQELDEMRANVPADFILESVELFAPIVVILQEADAVLANGRYLDIPPLLTKADSGLDAIAELDQMLQTHDEQRQQIVDLGAEGLHPPVLMTLENELSLSIDPLADAFRAGNYEAAQELMVEFAFDSEYALAETKEWQILQQANQEKIGEVQTNLERLKVYQNKTSTPAWEALQQFHKSNWQDLEVSVKETAVSLQQVEEKLPTIISMNKVENEVQQFDAVQATLTVLAAQLVHIEFQLKALVYRLEEVQTAEKSLPKAIQLTSAELKETIALRDAEDAKISPEVDQQINEANDALKEAETHVETKNFRAAIVAQSQVRQLARHAHNTATAEVDKINERLKQLSSLQTNVDDASANALREAQEMHESVLTTAVSESAKEAEAQWSVAQILATKTADLEDQTWLGALEKAIVAYQVAAKTTQIAQNHIQLAQKEYEQLVTAANKAKQKAQTAIKNAENARQLSGTGMSGEKALSQAKTNFSQLPSISGMPTKDSLKRFVREAKQVEDRAEISTGIAREAHRKYQARLRAKSHNHNSSWGSSSSSSSSWRSSSSSRSSSFGSRSSRSSSRSSRSRSSGSTSSRRRR